MTNLFLIILTIIFISISLIHFLWGSGFNWGIENTLPTDEDGKRILNPRKMDCFIMGFGLLAMASFYFLMLSMFEINLKHWIFSIGQWVIPSIFIVRAIGDFKYVGFSKRIKSTNFSKWDSKLYTPLCLFIGILGYLVAYIG